ncbi:NADPH-dependent 1-acyldihydroxyacetone phosphate reductase-like protein [Elsinoe fawcettii]|nr:NADPH-dependent 1-acyldihydroxyacetone phosphate reductase-like protein [Elsinoe fawcettii]
MSRKTVLITGCSDGGLGAALALAFHKRNYRVIATARNVSKMSSLKAQGIETLPLDVLSEASIKECVSTVQSTFGRLDMLINNAGAGYSMPIMDISVPELRDLFELNVFSLVPVTRAFLPLLRQSNGTVVVNTSIASVVSLPIQSSYNASKAAAASLTSALRLELAPFGVKVVELKTGAVSTNFFANVGAPKLPADSIYDPARKEIEAFMKGGDIMDQAMAADTWAGKVVGDLDRESPAYVIWRGAQATFARVGTLFPIWLFDGMLTKMTGLAVLATRLRAQGGMKRA